MVEAAPKPPVEPSITNGGSGFILSMSVSTGMDDGGGAGVLAAVLASG